MHVLSPNKFSTAESPSLKTLRSVRGCAGWDLEVGRSGIWDDKHFTGSDARLQEGRGWYEHASRYKISPGGVKEFLGGNGTRPEKYGALWWGEPHSWKTNEHRILLVINRLNIFPSLTGQGRTSRVSGLFSFVTPSWEPFPGALLPLRLREPSPSTHRANNCKQAGCRWKFRMGIIPATLRPSCTLLYCVKWCYLT
jgi:hypothetical protein